VVHCKNISQDHSHRAGVEHFGEGPARTQPAFALGLSPRGSLALLAAARAWAMLAGRDYVIPEDVQAVLPSVAGHRLRDQADPAGHGGGALVQWLLREVTPF
jgi:MoxR-like ATPase